MNHLKNITNQLSGSDNPKIDTKIATIRPPDAEICNTRFSDGGHLGFGPKRGLMGSKNLDPMMFSLFRS
ncbi:MAG: hypothetical protein ABW185_03880 [Sedimenticola sp.]